MNPLAWWKAIRKSLIKHCVFNKSGTVSKAKTTCLNPFAFLILFLKPWRTREVVIVIEFGEVQLENIGFIRVNWQQTYPLSCLSFISFSLPHSLLLLFVGEWEICTLCCLPECHFLPEPSLVIAWVWVIGFCIFLPLFSEHDLHLLHLCDIGSVLSSLISFLSNCFLQFIFMTPGSTSMCLLA